MKIHDLSFFLAFLLLLVIASIKKLNKMFFFSCFLFCEEKFGFKTSLKSHKMIFILCYSKKKRKNVFLINFHTKKQSLKGIDPISVEN